MNIQKLSQKYGRLRDKFADLDAERERIIATRDTDLKALGDVDQSLQYLLKRVCSYDHAFKKVVSPGLLRRAYAEKILQKRDTPEARFLEQFLVMFQIILPSITPHTKKIIALLDKEKESSSLEKIEIDIKENLKHIYKVLGSYQNQLAALGSREASGTTGEQYLIGSNPTFWVFVKLCAAIAIFLSALSSLQPRSVGIGRKTALVTAAAAGIAVGHEAVTDMKGTKSLIYNAMSHNTQFNTVKDVIEMPRMLFTRGYYKGVSDGNTDLNAIYLGLAPNTLAVSKYRPSNASIPPNTKLYALKPFVSDITMVVGLRIAPKDGLRKLLSMKKGEVLSWQEIMHPQGMPIIKLVPPAFTTIDLTNYTLSFGRDENGIYTSAFDVWDFSPNAGYFKESGALLDRAARRLLPLAGQPIYFYDRFYWKEFGVTDEDIIAHLRLLDAQGKENDTMQEY